MRHFQPDKACSYFVYLHQLNSSYISPFLFFGELISIQMNAKIIICCFDKVLRELFFFFLAKNIQLACQSVIIEIQIKTYHTHEIR